MMKNKKNPTRLIPVCALLTVCLSSLTGCNKKVPDTDQTLEVWTAKLGFGSDWTKDLLDAFKEEAWVKEKYPNLQTIFETSADRSAINTRLDAGEGVNTVDLVFSDSVTPYMGEDNQGNARSVDLTDVVYRSKVPGEDIMVYDKLRDDWKAQTAYYSVGENSFSGKVPYKTYDFLWGSGMMGIVYNEELYKSFGYDVPPRTSEELIEVSNKIKEGNDKYKEGYTYMYSAGGDYMGYLYQIWWGQYEGIDNIYNYYQGIGFDGENYVEKSSDIFKQVGRKEAMNELIKLSMKENGLRYARGAATDFKAAQKFYFQGKGVFMCNGDWLAEENKEDLAASPYHFKMMKTPIISSIRQKTPSIPDDATLRKVVQAIDEGKTFGMANIDGVSEADYQTIMDARGVTLSLGAGFHSCIPSYAAGKDVAVDFLRFMATDKAQEIYAKATGGATLPFKYKMSDKAIFNDFSDLQKSVIDMREKSIYNSTCMPLGTNMPLVKFGNLGIWTSYALNGTWDINYAQNGSLDPKNEWSAQAAYDRDIDYWTNNNGEKWNNALRLAGFIK